MTFITKLKLKNFKSFAKPTELQFGNAFNTIIGPNGAGKSNVADAVCFVLGKSSAKSMRAEKSANLIYNGGKQGNPAKEASVSIEFDNSKNIFPIKSDSVEITRIVRQNGNSIYKINDETRTRQQVLDLLAVAKIDPDGHNIILQGDIAHLIDMKTEERRQIIEEIAGISVYEDKKQKALLELEKVDSKLNEATIILTEREAHLREIKRDYDQAKQYKELEVNVKNNKATILNHHINEREEKKQAIEVRINEHKSSIDKVSSNIKEVKDLIASKKEEIKTINSELEEKGEVEQLNLNKEITDLKTDIVKSTSRTEQLQSELEKIKSRKMQLANDLKDLDGKLSLLDKRKKELGSKNKALLVSKGKLQKDIDEYKEKHGISNIKEFNEKLDSIEKELEVSSMSFSNLQSNKQTLLSSKSNLSYKLHLLEESIFKSKELESNPELAKLRQEFKKATLELSKVSNEDSITQSQLNKARSRLLVLNDELAKLRARNITAVERNAANAAIKRILSLKDPKIYGTVSQLGKVERKYALALEVAAGQRVNSIVTQDDLAAAKCIRLLKDEKLGIATFLPINKIKQRIDQPGIKELSKNTHGLAIDLVSFDKKFQDVFSYVFGSTIIVDDIESARKIGIGRARMVTIEGDLLEPSGAMHGGYRKHLPSFKEKDTELNISNQEKEAEHLKSTIDLLEQKKIDLENNMISVKQKKYELEGNIIKIERSSNVENIGNLEKEKSSILEEISKINDNLKAIDKDLINYNKELEDFKVKKRKLKEKLSVSKDANVSSNLDRLESERQSIIEELIKNESEVKNLDTQSSSIYLAEKEKIKQIINQHEKEQLEFSKELEETISRLKDKRLMLKDKEAKEKQFYSDFRQLSSRRNKLTEDIQVKETSISKEEFRIKEIEHKINDISLDRAKLVAELEGLAKEFEQYQDGKIRKGISIEELKDETKKFEKLMQNLGTVNMRAIEIYDDLQKEHSRLIEKTEKLKIEKEDVLKMMYSIEERKKDIFMSTFKEIEKNFTSIFSNLSKKGQAYLELENSEDPLSAGLEITVKLTGNKKLDIRSLSGGEKTLAALAFIFAIQEHQPASFYFLDEVDASLDKTNSQMLSKLIAKYSQGAQYIVISHNDAVITEAEHIYGVSMQQEGVSKVISLKI